MQRLSSWLIALLAVAVFAAAGYVVTTKDTVPDAGTVPPAAAASVRAGASVTSSSPPAASGSASSPAGPVVVAFLGDDWTAGTGASATAKRFTTLLARTLGLRERNFGVDGTGYAKTSAGGGAYASRLEDVVAAHPDVVVVAGGRNDISDYEPTLRARVRSLFADLHERLPAARVIALAPMWGDSDPPAELGPVSAAVRRYVTAAGGTYLDIADPVRGHPGYMTDASDPDDRGYAAIATALAPVLRPLLG